MPDIGTFLIQDKERACIDLAEDNLSLYTALSLYILFKRVSYLKHGRDGRIPAFRGDGKAYGAPLVPPCHQLKGQALQANPQAPS